VFVPLCSSTFLPAAQTAFKVSIVKQAEGNITFPYILERGISDQSIGLELLVQEGLFDASILASRPQLATT
jgi:hypothetical protein